MKIFYFAYWVSHNILQGENLKIIFMTNYCNQTLYIGDIIRGEENGENI